MQIEGWKYYNHATIPTTAPHEMPDLRAVEKGDVWKIGGGYSSIGEMDSRLGLWI